VNQEVTQAVLVLEDGAVFRGRGFGATGTAFGEVVFNTGMTGYQEVLTDPSYHRQLVAMTSVQQGNYGITDADAESSRVQVSGFIVREEARRMSNWRAQRSLADELRAYGTVGISEIDTRRLTRHIRSLGAMRAVISTDVLDVDELISQVQAAPGMEGANLAAEVSTSTVYQANEVAGVDVVDPRFRVVAYDFGIKHNILRLLAAHGCEVTVVPSTMSADDVLALEPDGVFLSNGPGDPAAVRSGIAAVTTLLATDTPVFGICLGHQILGLAAGASSYKMRFGHRGSNQPVKNVEREVVEITSHNHGFALDAESLPQDGPFGRVTQTHVNLNDQVNEGLRLHDVPAFSVQYHPEAAPGPHDARYLFQQFCDVMNATKGKA